MNLKTAEKAYEEMEKNRRNSFHSTIGAKFSIRLAIRPSPSGHPRILDLFQDTIVIAFVSQAPDARAEFTQRTAYGVLSGTGISIRQFKSNVVRIRGVYRGHGDFPF
jgi:hypothetical protein